MQADIIKLFENDSSATKDSGKVFIGNYDKVAILLRRANHSAGQGAFTVKGGFADGTADDPTMTALNTLIDNVANTNGQTLTRVAGKTVTTNGDYFLWLSPETPVTHLQVSVARTTDGSHSAYLIGFNNN